MSAELNAATCAIFDRPQNRKIVESLAAAGEQVVLFPPAAPEPRDLAPDESALLADARGADWLVVTDVWAADFFVDLLRERDVDLFELDEVRICALGEAVSDRLRFVQIHADVIPVFVDAENVVSGIVDYQGGDLAGLQMLCLGDRRETAPLCELLARAGARADRLEVYALRFEERQLTRLKTLVKGGAVDRFVFSQPEDVLLLRRYFAGESLTGLLADTKCFALNEPTFQSLSESRLRPLYYHAR